MSDWLDRTCWRAFDSVFAPVMQRRLRVCVSGPVPVIAAGPIVLVANHVSWWDGFVLRVVQRALRPASPLRTVALERELQRHPLLRRLGAIGIDPASPASILRALRVIHRMRADDPVLGYFPQGRIAPTFARPLGFQRGIDLVLRSIAPATVIPVAIHVEPLAHFVPTALVAIGAPITATACTHVRLEQRVTQLLDDVLGFVGAHGEETDRAWHHFRPSTFQPEISVPMRPQLVC